MQNLAISPKTSWICQPIAFLGLAFLLLFSSNWQEGGVNANSRFASIRAMSVDHTFRIDPYIDWTMDWSRTPDGKYYSNKAPGPAFIALPLDWVLDQFYPPAHQKDQLSLERKSVILILFQVVPFFIFAMLALQILAETGVSRQGQVFAALAIFFGNTVCYFMNTYFGHGMAAWMVLALFVAVYRRRYFWVGMAFGWAALTDYGCTLLLLPLAIVLVKDHRTQPELRGKLPKNLVYIALGGLLPGLLWIVYHTACFGSPFTLGQNFQNPAFIKNGTQHGDLGSVIQLLPPFEHVWQLLFGAQRGILITQPWVLLIVPAAIYLRPTRMPRALTWITLLGFFEVFWMNAGFSGWHGGGSAGPRYLSMMFPLLGLVAGYVYDSRTGIFRNLLWGTLGVGLAMGSLIYSWDSLCPEGQTMWPFYLEKLLWRFPGHPLVNFSVFIIIVSGASRLALRSGTKRIAEA